MSDGLILPWREYFPAAVNNNGAAAPLFNVYGTPTPTVRIGSNIDRAVLTFPNSGVSVAELNIQLPRDIHLPGGVSARLLWATPATAGDMKWSVATAFVMPIDGDQDDLDPTTNPGSNVITPAASAAHHLIKSDVAALDLTDARAGAWMVLQVVRDSGDTDDTLADDADLIGIELVYQRRIVLP